MIQSHSGKKHSQQTIVAVCQGRSSLNTRQSLCAEFDCRTGMTSPERSLQTHSFCLSCQQHSTTDKGLPGTHLCRVPGLSPICSHFSSPLEHPEAVGAAPGHYSFPRKAVLCPATHSCTPSLTCSLAGPGDLLPYGQPLQFSSSELSLTNLFVLMLLKPISLCNFPKLLGNLLSFSRFPFLISIYTLNSSTSFFTHGMSLFLMLDYFLHSLIQSDLFHS